MKKIDTKILYNQCGLEKVLQKKYQDSNSCPVYSVSLEYCNHLYTYPGTTTTEVLKKGTDELKPILQEKETLPVIQTAFLGALPFI